MKLIKLLRIHTWFLVVFPKNNKTTAAIIKIIKIIKTLISVLALAFASCSTVSRRHSFLVSNFQCRNISILYSDWQVNMG